MLVAGVRPEDEVLVSDLTFVAPANAVRYAGAHPVFIDVEPNYWQMDPELVQEFLDKRCVWREGALFNRITGRRIRAVLPVHILGHPVRMRPIWELARKYELHIIEDATEGLGAEYEEQPVGSLADVGCLSFNGNKLITTGGGGMIVTNRDDWAQRARYLTTQAKDDAVEYVHNEIGYNYRLTNIQAAMGVAQMEMLDGYIASKRAIAAGYENGFQSFRGIQPMQEAPWAHSVYWMYTISLSENDYGMNARALMQLFAAAGIQTRPLWQPLHLSRAHQGAQIMGGSVAEDLWRNALSLPCSVGLTMPEQQRVVDFVAVNRARETKPKNVFQMEVRLGAS
jgi:perosamine synthetase